MEEKREDWPFGPELKRQRERSGLSQREAARRTTPTAGDKPAVSAGRWAQLETGWQKNKGALIPIGTTAATVAAAARAVGWDVAEALGVAGFDPATDIPAVPVDGIGRFSDDELIAEIRRRMKGAHHDMEAAQESAAPPPEDEDEKIGLPGRRPLEMPDVQLPPQESGPPPHPERDRKPPEVGGTDPLSKEA